WRVLGRLQHDRAGRGGCAGEFPAGELDRVVPRHDARDRPDRFFLHDAEETGRVVGDRAAEDALGLLRVVVQRRHELGDLAARLVAWFALLARDRDGELVDAGRADLGQSVQVAGTFGGKRLAPR